MYTLEILLKDELYDEIPCESLSHAKSLANIHSTANDNKTFVYVTHNPQTNISNTIVIKRPHYG